MDIPDKRHPECPDVHLGGCPKCRRLWERDLARSPKPATEKLASSSAAEQRPVKSRVVGSNPTSSAKNRVDVLGAVTVLPQTLHVSTHCDPENFDGTSAERDDTSEAEDEDAVSEGVEGSIKPDRLAVALSGAEKQRRYREKHGAVYRKREAARQKDRRAKIRGSPKSPEE